MEVSASSTKAAKEASDQGILVKSDHLPELLNSIHILALNDDCLFALLGFLKVGDQINFSRVCCDFQNVFKEYAKFTYKHCNIDVFNELTRSDSYEFISLAGPIMESFAYRKLLCTCENIVWSLIQSCKNMQKISLIKFRFSEHLMQKLVLNMSKVTELTLVYCSLQDASVKHIHFLKHLRELTLDWNNEITGKYISKIVTLKKLSLIYCKNIKASNINKIFQELTELEELDIRGCKNKFDTAYDELVRHAKNLQILKISLYDAHAQHEKIALLPNLKVLSLHARGYKFKISHKLFNELVRHKSESLENLRIFDNICITHNLIRLISGLKQLKCLVIRDGSINDVMPLTALTHLEELDLSYCKFSQENLLNIVHACTKLRLLNVQYCRQLTNSFVLALSRNANRTCAESERRKKPLIIYVAGTNIDESAINDANSNEADSFIHITSKPEYRNED